MLTMLKYWSIAAYNSSSNLPIGLPTMLAHRIEATVKRDKTLTLENLPFHAGERVEIIILSRPQQVSQQDLYPLRGTTIQYIDPTEPVAQNDWEISL
jgi:hypothetical protein